MSLTETIVTCWTRYLRVASQTSDDRNSFCKADRKAHGQFRVASGAWGSDQCEEAAASGM